MKSQPLLLRRLFQIGAIAVVVVQTACQVSVTPGSSRSAASRKPKIPATPLVFDVRNYGAVGDGKNLDSPAINEAILAASAAGGGKVVLPAGTYLSGSIRLTNNIHLYLEAGCTILAAPQDLQAYDEEEPWEGIAYQDGGHTFFHNSLIWGENITNVFITGPGFIDGTALSRGDGNQDRRSGFNNWNSANPTNALHLPTQRLGNKAIALKLCKNVILRDFTIFKGGHFAILATGIDGFTVDNVTMDTNRDGIDIDCCRNVTVSNCRINSPHDDALCPKSSFALGTNVITENMTIVNCQVSGFEVGTLLDGTMKPAPNGNGRIKFGTEANGGFRNITVANCTFRSCRGLALEEVDGGIMENIVINNLTMMDVPVYAIYVTTGKRNRGPNVKQPSVARNILISNVVADGIRPVNGMHTGMILAGLEEQPIEGLRLENIRLGFVGGGTKEDAERVPAELGTRYPEPRNHGIQPAYGIFARHIRGLEFENITMTFDKEDFRPAMVGINIDGLEIDNFKAELSPGVPAARFEGVKNVVIRNSPVLESAVTK